MRAIEIGVIGKRLSTQILNSFIPNTISPSGHSIYIIGDQEFVKVPKGKFYMGNSSTDSKVFSDEKPQHVVNISYDYLIGRFPVTNQQFAVFAESIGLSKVSWGAIGSIATILDHPVVLVDWHQALKYCNWLTKRLSIDLPAGYVFRLPTEAEWEKAARGVDNRIYPWGNELPQSHRANISFSMFNGMMKLLTANRTSPVNKYTPISDSPFGVADMAGNVWEWTQSLFRSYPYNPKDGRENLAIAGDRIARGGSHLDGQDESRVTFRSCVKNPEFGTGFMGFRVVIGPKKIP